MAAYPEIWRSGTKIRTCTIMDRKKSSSAAARTFLHSKSRKSCMPVQPCLSARWWLRPMRNRVKFPRRLWW